jgi:transposase-like protein
MADQDRERWTKLVADFETSDLTQREFASERGISFSNLRNWIYRLRKESRPLVEAAPASSGQAPARAPTVRHSRLVPVRVVASAPKARLVEPSATLLELALPTGVVVRFPPGTQPSYLRAIIAEL